MTVPQNVKCLVERQIREQMSPLINKTTGMVGRRVQGHHREKTSLFSWKDRQHLAFPRAGAAEGWSKAESLFRKISKARLGHWLRISYYELRWVPPVLLNTYILNGFINK